MTCIGIFVAAMDGVSINRPKAGSRRCSFRSWSGHVGRRLPAAGEDLVTTSDGTSRGFPIRTARLWDETAKVCRNDVISSPKSRSGWHACCLPFSPRMS